jgi:hypothetical protein
MAHFPKRPALMSDIENARRVFRDAGLGFPTIPKELADRLKEYRPWLYSTRTIDISPYKLQHYLDEAEESPVEDYALLSHSGHGVNSYAIQYYIVHRSLRLFLHLAWGGTYMNNQECASTIRKCFSIADQIESLAQAVQWLRGDKQFTVVGSDYYGSYWLPPGGTRQQKDADSKDPLTVLIEAFDWLSRY